VNGVTHPAKICGAGDRWGLRGEALAAPHSYGKGSADACAAFVRSHEGDWPSFAWSAATTWCFACSQEDVTLHLRADARYDVYVTRHFNPAPAPAAGSEDLLDSFHRGEHRDPFDFHMHSSHSGATGLRGLFGLEARAEAAARLGGFPERTGEAPVDRSRPQPVSYGHEHGGGAERRARRGLLAAFTCALIVVASIGAAGFLALHAHQYQYQHQSADASVAARLGSPGPGGERSEGRSGLLAALRRTTTGAPIH